MSTQAAFSLAVGAFIIWFVSSGRANAFFQAIRGPAGQGPGQSHDHGD